ncbi:hypothetical protein T4B_8857 [Trichinella pseudospiralis]|uniref:Uncharacterized protein n=1 Tax=Trichinella pseudospiralis TaxID=6337 RepID=A0A0V1G7P7_TRIPS|nr:hypothetical protein T4B_8857 [Trichinella pseudospiralis]
MSIFEKNAFSREFQNFLNLFFIDLLYFAKF